MIIPAAHLPVQYVPPDVKPSLHQSAQQIPSLDLFCQAHRNCKLGHALPVTSCDDVLSFAYDFLQGRTPLHLAAGQSWSDCVVPSRLEDLLKHKADVNSVDKTVSWSKYCVATSQLCNDNAAKPSIVVYVGVCAQGMSALHLLVDFLGRGPELASDADGVRVLVTHGADVNIANNKVGTQDRRL